MNKYLVLYAIHNGETTLCSITSRIIEAKDKMGAIYNSPRHLYEDGYDHLTLKPLHIELLEKVSDE